MSSRRRMEPRIPAHRNAFLTWLFNAYATTMLQRQFSSVRVHNPQGLAQRMPDRPTLCFSNHCNWWDGLTDFLLVNRLAPGDRLFMMVEELWRFPILSLLGAFSVEKDSPQAAIKTLQYARELLAENPRHLMWIYPQGMVMPQGRRPLGFAHGVGYLAQKIPGLNLLPVAHCYSFLREDRPEIFVRVGTPFTVNADEASDRKVITQRMEDEVTALLDAIQRDLAECDLDEYHTLVQGVLNPYKVLEISVNRSFQAFQTLAAPWRLAMAKPRPKL